MEKTLKQQPTPLLKIVLFGPESTGKTTLSRQLALHYHTVWAPEFLRHFAQQKWDNEGIACEEKDVITIAKGQINLENEYAQRANKILVCDTDLLETKVYAETYFKGFSNAALESAATNNTYDMYFLTYIDTPWEGDDLRDKPEQREEMFTAFENALIKYNRPYTLLKGDKATRLKKAIEVIDILLKKKRS